MIFKKFVEKFLFIFETYFLAYIVRIDLEIFYLVQNSSVFVKNILRDLNFTENTLHD